MTSIPGSKESGIFIPLGAKVILWVKITTICCGFVKAETQAYGGRFCKFGFAAMVRVKNEGGIKDRVSIGYRN